MNIARLLTGGALLLLAACTSPARDSGSAAAAVAQRTRPPAAAASERGDVPGEGRSQAVTATPSRGTERAGGPGSASSSQVAEPTAVEIPAIGVSSRLIELGLNDDRTLEVPSDFDLAGWYTGRPPPGAVGPAVIVGHVDSRAGPAVFHRLRELARGDEILVRRADAPTARFVVDRVEQHAKDAFPTDAVYGPTDEAALRLITCGGSFDSGRRSYVDNVVVFATLV